MGDPFDLQRFIDAQQPFYDQVTAELRSGRKTTHWMWFVFPQLVGLAYSPMALRYAITGHDEATAYLEHPILGKRLHECTDLVLRVDGRSVYEIFGTPDDFKFRSSMTLFALCASKPDAFERALAKYFGGETDHKTFALLNARAS